MGLLECIVLLVLWQNVFIPSCKGENYYGTRIGSFSKLAHDVSGTVYAVNSKTLFIKDFNYDGAGPDAFFWVLENDAGANTEGIIMADENGSKGILGSYSDKDIVVTLPNGLTIDDIRWLSVWCRQFKVNFGSLTIGDVNYPEPVDLGKFSELAHEVKSGEVTLLDTRRIRIKNLHYDGRGPDAFFLVGTGTITHDGATKVPDESGSTSKLKGYSGQTIIITLPAGTSITDFEWLSMYCIRATQNFGDVSISIPGVKKIPPNLDDMEEPPLENCENLHENLNVAWMIKGSDIMFELSGYLDEGEYMAFGISGKTDMSYMGGADVVIAYQDDTATSMAVDYDINGYSQCSQGKGVCPDTEAGGTNDVTSVSGVKKSGILSIRFTRKLNTGNSEDKVFSTTEDTYVVWAIGKMNGNGRPLKHHLRIEGNLKIDFGRSPSMNCQDLESPESETYTKWKIPRILGDNTFTFRARMGPTGGDRGYEAITGSSSWGIAWYLNGLLIPEVVLKIGVEYTFISEGGDNATNGAKYHPLYITNDEAGGYSQKTAKEKQDVDIYAGVSSEETLLGVGPYCEWKPKTEDKWKESETFEEYKKTLMPSCQKEINTGTFKWTPTDSTPSLVYYQCYTHTGLGWKIHVTDDIANFVNNGSRKDIQIKFVAAIEIVVTVITQLLLRGK